MADRTCQNCKTPFTIAPEDLKFYEKIAVPPPTWCPPCRNTRRLAWREEHTLYHAICALCKKPTLSIHAPAGPFKIYCRDCHHSDKWDSLEYGRDYDFNKPFFQQYRELMEAVPRPALTGHSLVNSEYSHASLNCKNCYFVFWSYFTENSQYSYGLLLSRDTYDSYTTDNSDHVYEAVHCNRLYRTRSTYFTDDCLDSSLMFNCLGCSDCFGCVNLRKQKYCLFNEQLSKEEYFKQLAYWNLGSYARLQEAKEKFRRLREATPQRFANITSGVNVSGDIIRDTKNCQMCFSVTDGVENCKFIYFGGLNLKDSYDINYGGDLSELLYETVAVTSSQSCQFCGGNTGSKNITYSDWARNSSDCFGCVSVANKRYCILNKQYSKDEYFALIKKIRKHMDDMPYTDKHGRIYAYGEFFPTELSAYAYNESLAFQWSPKTKEEVLAQGWQWRETATRDYKITIEWSKLPDHIRDVGDSILDQVISCEHGGTCNEECSTAFRITVPELAFYRDMNIALPRLCPNCRYAQRLMTRNGYQLWKRRCMCPNGAYQNGTAHAHGDQPCPNEFETTFAPEQPTIVYCDQCYKTEFI